MKKEAWIKDLLDQYEKKVVTYAFRILADVDLSRDVAQDTFMKLWQQNPEKLKDKEEQWLFRVCRNAAIDILRKRAKEQNSNNTNFLDKHPFEANDAIEAKENRQMVLSALDQLTIKQQEIIHLKYKENMSYKQIAEVTGHTVSNVGYILNDAMKQLRAILNPQQRVGAANERQ